MSASCEVRGEARPALLGAWAEYLDRIAKKGGPEPADFGLLADWFCRAAAAVGDQTVTRTDVCRLLAGAEPAISSGLTMQGMARAQPYGYPGDFELIDRIYKECVSSNPALAKWDFFFHAQPAIRALLHAKAHFCSWLAKAEACCDALLPHVRLLHLGGGSGRELLEYFLENPGSRVVCDYMDADSRAVSYAAWICAPVGGRVRLHQANPLGFQPAGMPHLIWASGLFDYLDDPNLLSVLRRLWHLLAPGGKFVSSNFSRSNPSQAYLDLLGWRLHHRDASDLHRLALQVGVPEEAIRVTADPGGVYLFLHLEKRYPTSPR